MEKNISKNILVIDNLESESIEQVIVILKEVPAGDVPRDIIEEANEIVGRYSKRIEAGQYRAVKRQRKGWFFKRRNKY